MITFFNTLSEKDKYLYRGKSHIRKHLNCSFPIVDAGKGELKNNNLSDSDQIKKLFMSTDGALAQKLDAWVMANLRYAEEMGKQKWVPEIQMMGDATSKGNSANGLLSLFLAKTAKDINLRVPAKQ